MTTPDTTSGRPGWWARFARVEASEGDHAVTPLELFFDLVFVFAHHPGDGVHGPRPELARPAPRPGDDRAAVVGLVRYAWLGNQARADEGDRPGRAGAGDGGDVPGRADHSRGMGRPRRWPERAVRARGRLSQWSVVVHLAVYSVAARATTRCAAQLRPDRGARRHSPPSCWSSARCSAGSPRRCCGCWRSSSTMSASTPSGAEWRLPSPAHFAERHGLIIIIALGESVVAIGVGVGDRRSPVPVVVAALLGLAVVAARCGGPTSTWSRWSPSTCSRRPGREREPARARLVHLPALPDGRRHHLPGPRDSRR